MSIYNTLTEGQRNTLSMILDGWFQRLDVLMSYYDTEFCLAIRDELLQQWKAGTENALTEAISESFDSDSFPTIVFNEWEQFSELNLTEIENASANLDIRKCITLAFYDFLALFSNPDFVATASADFGTDEFVPVEYDVEQTLMETYEAWYDRGHICLVSGVTLDFIKSCPSYVQEILFNKIRSIEYASQIPAEQFAEKDGMSPSFYFIPKKSVEMMQAVFNELMTDPENEKIDRAEFRKKAKALIAAEIPDFAPEEKGLEVSYNVSKTIH